MAKGYHPPTGRTCDICEAHVSEAEWSARAPERHIAVHRWYQFVLGYSSSFVDAVIDSYAHDERTVVLDPFMGTGTTLVAAKRRGYLSFGIDGNPFMVDMAKVKLNWRVDALELIKSMERLIHEATTAPVLDLNRPKLLLPAYMDDETLMQFRRLSWALYLIQVTTSIRQALNLAILSSLVAASNIQYGPGFTIRKRKEHADVFKLVEDKVKMMVSDLLQPDIRGSKAVFAQPSVGDARSFTLPPSDLIITSPPYPGDHEYIKHTKLEILYGGYAADQEDVRGLKQRLVRSATTAVYAADNDSRFVDGWGNLEYICNQIDERVEADSAGRGRRPSGYEKLYSTLTREYFGGMFLALRAMRDNLSNGGIAVLLVSDSHAFKMVHIETARMLGELAKMVGYRNYELKLWQYKRSTSHGYRIPEYALVLKR